MLQRYQIRFTYRQKGFSWDGHLNSKTKQCAVLSSTLWHLFHGSHWERLPCELIRRLYCQPALSGHIGKEIPSPAPQPHLHPSLAIKTRLLPHHSSFLLLTTALSQSVFVIVCMDPIAHGPQFYIHFLGGKILMKTWAVSISIKKMAWYRTNIYTYMWPTTVISAFLELEGSRMWRNACQCGCIWGNK